MANTPYGQAFPPGYRPPSQLVGPRPNGSVLGAGLRPASAGQPMQISAGLRPGAPRGVASLPGGQFQAPDFASFYNPGAGGNPYDFSDPILQKIQAINTQARQDALASALASRKELAIAYGDSSGVLSGDQFDQGTADAASGNPFSTLAEIRRNYERGNSALDESLNKEGLFYSGERARQLGLSAEEEQRQMAGAAGTLQGRVGDVQSGLAAALMNADRADATAAADAAARAQQQAVTNGYDPGAVAPPPAPAPTSPTSSVLSTGAASLGGAPAPATYLNSVTPATAPMSPLLLALAPRPKWTP